LIASPSEVVDKNDGIFWSEILPEQVSSMNEQIVEASGPQAIRNPERM
jgi:hypothetical protein